MTVTRGGKAYKLELCELHLHPLDDLLSLGTRTSPRTSPRKPRKAAPRRRRKVSDSEIRAWAIENNVEVNPMGRVPVAVRDQYLAAH